MLLKISKTLPNFYRVIQASELICKDIQNNTSKITETDDSKYMVIVKNIIPAY